MATAAAACETTFSAAYRAQDQEVGEAWRGRLAGSKRSTTTWMAGERCVAGACPTVAAPAIPWDFYATADPVPVPASHPAQEPTTQWEGGPMDRPRGRRAR
jgi:hypothetical protein